MLEAAARRRESRGPRFSGVGLAAWLHWLRSQEWRGVEIGLPNMTEPDTTNASATAVGAFDILRILRPWPAGRPR